MFTIRLLSDFKYAFHCIRKHRLLGGWVGDCYVFVYLFMYASTPLFMLTSCIELNITVAVSPFLLGKKW